ncbi:MAG: hypothetical protein WC928_03570 [Patescibacteria group bacterium]|jgi:hypothetical protein
MAEHKRYRRGVIKKETPSSAGAETPVVEKKKKEKEEKSRLHNFAISGLNFFLAFLVGALVIMIFFVLTKNFHFIKNFHQDFWVKAIISLILAAMILRVADIVNEKKTAFSKAVPVALLTLFLGLIIWHYGYCSEPIDELKLRIDMGNKVEIPEFPKKQFALSYNQESGFISIPDNCRYRIVGDEGNFEVIFEGGPTIIVGLNEDFEMPHVEKATFKIKSFFNGGNQKFKIFWESKY